MKAPVSSELTKTSKGNKTSATATLEVNKSVITVTNSYSTAVDTGVGLSSGHIMLIILAIMIIAGGTGMKFYLTNERKRRYGR